MNAKDRLRTWFAANGLPEPYVIGLADYTDAAGQPDPQIQVELYGRASMYPKRQIESDWGAAQAHLEKFFADDLARAAERQR